MKFKELIRNPDFLLNTNISLALMKLLEDTGISKNELQGDKYDEIIQKTKEKILDHFQKFINQNIIVDENKSKK